MKMVRVLTVLTVLATVALPAGTLSAQGKADPGAKPAAAEKSAAKSTALCDGMPQCVVLEYTLRTGNVMLFKNNSQMCGTGRGLGGASPNKPWDMKYADLKNPTGVSACLSTNPSYPKANFVIVAAAGDTTAKYLTIGYPGSRTATVTIAPATCMSVNPQPQPARCTITFSPLK